MTEDFPIRPRTSENRLRDDVGEATGIRDAQRQGLTLYWTGRPCGRNHYDYRYAVSGMCRTCARQRRNENRGYPSDGSRGRPVRHARNHENLPAVMRTVDDARVALNYSGKELSRMMDRNPDWYRNLMEKRSLPKTHRDAARLEATLELQPGTLTRFFE